MRQFIPLTVLTLAAVLAIVGLTLWRALMPPSTNGAGPGSEARLIIISPNNDVIQREFARAFVKWHKERYGTEAEVEFQDHGGTSDDMKFIKSEFGASPAGIGIDVFWGGGAEPYLQLSEAGLLQPVDLPELVISALPKTVGGVPVYDPQRRWFGTALSSFGIIANRNRLNELKLPQPKTWADLGEPAFFNEVAAADPTASGTALAMVEVILQAYGWEKGFAVLTRSAANVQTFTRGANEVPKLVSTGQVACGSVVDFYAWMQIQLDGKEKITYTLPEGLTPITPDGIGVLKGAPHADLAARFVEFVLSEQGQALWVLPKGTPGGPVEADLLRMPVLPEVYKKYASVTNVMFDPSQAKAGFHYDPRKAAARRDALKDLYKAVFIDLSPEMRGAWRAVIQRGLRPADLERLCAPYTTEEQLAADSAKWTDAVYRNEKIAEWSNAARARYRGIAAQP